MQWLVTVSCKIENFIGLDISLILRIRSFVTSFSGSLEWSPLSSSTSLTIERLSSCWSMFLSFACYLSLVWLSRVDYIAGSMDEMSSNIFNSTATLAIMLLFSMAVSTSYQDLKLWFSIDCSGSPSGSTLQTVCSFHRGEQAKGRVASYLWVSKSSSCWRLVWIALHILTWTWCSLTVY